MAQQEKSSNSQPQRTVGELVQHINRALTERKLSITDSNEFSAMVEEFIKCDPRKKLTEAEYLKFMELFNNIVERNLSPSPSSKRGF